MTNPTSNSQSSPPRLSVSSPLLSLVGIGPGNLNQLTPAANKALQNAEVIIGYKIYVEMVDPLLNDAQEIVISALGSEMERARQAVKLAASGKRVAMVSSGDIGIYAMASPVFEALRQFGDTPPEVEVFPGISAVQAAAAKLGAPLGHDFCTISLSDLLTPWPVIERRVQAAAWGDFVIAFYNPRSQKRDWQLNRALEILLAHRAGNTPAALIRNVTRPDEQITQTTLAELDPAQVDMFTLVLVGNSQSYTLNNRLVTPRGYVDEEAKSRGGEEAKIGSDENSSRPRVLASSPPLTSSVYPITLTQIADAPAVVIGGGPVGERKVGGLLTVGASVTLVSPEATAQLQSWAETGRIQWQQRTYQSGDLAGARLVFAATNQRQVNAQIAVDAQAQHALCNVADAPDEGNFHLPAVYRGKGLVVAVGTGGNGPKRARLTRDKIAQFLADE